MWFQPILIARFAPPPHATLCLCACACCLALFFVNRLSLNVMTLLPRCESVETLHGVAVTVTAVAQVMVMAENSLAVSLVALALFPLFRATPASVGGRQTPPSPSPNNLSFLRPFSCLCSPLAPGNGKRRRPGCVPAQGPRAVSRQIPERDP